MLKGTTLRRSLVALRTLKGIALGMFLVELYILKSITLGRSLVALCTLRGINLGMSLVALCTFKGSTLGRCLVALRIVRGINLGKSLVALCTFKGSTLGRSLVALRTVRGINLGKSLVALCTFKGIMLGRSLAVCRRAFNMLPSGVLNLSGNEQTHGFGDSINRHFLVTSRLRWSCPVFSGSVTSLQYWQNGPGWRPVQLADSVTPRDTVPGTHRIRDRSDR
jgi:hypothetical protein